MDPVTRRRVGRLAQVAIVLVGILIACAWFYNKKVVRGRSVHFETASAPVDSLGRGDVRIYNVDSSVAVTLAGPRILAGLSPRTVERVREEMAREAQSETTGIGATIARAVKSGVSSALATQVTYRVADIDDMRYEDGHITIESPDGRTTLFHNVKIHDSRDAERFREEDAQVLIAAFRARKAELSAAPHQP